MNAELQKLHLSLRSAQAAGDAALAEEIEELIADFNVLEERVQRLEKRPAVAVSGGGAIGGPGPTGPAGPPGPVANSYFPSGWM